MRRRSFTPRQVAERAKLRERRISRSVEMGLRRETIRANERAHYARQAQQAAQRRQEEAERTTRDLVYQMQGLEAKLRALAVPVEISLGTRSVLVLSERTFQPYGDRGPGAAEMLGLFKKEVRHRIAAAFTEQIMAQVQPLIDGATSVTDMAAALRPFVTLQYHTAHGAVLELGMAARRGYLGAVR